MTFLKWFYPGLNIKRWIFVCVLATAAASFGGYLTFDPRIPAVLRALGIAVIVCGIAAVLVSIIIICHSLVVMLIPVSRYTELHLALEKKYLQKGPRIVTIGGGTGLSVILAGLKSLSSNISAVVTVTDDGGSSGRLRRDFDMLPPGDIRNCLVALADAPPLLGKLFQYRFEKGDGLKGHNFGNLFILAMTHILGDFEKGVRESSKVLSIRGEVIPSTLEPVSLVASFKDSEDVCGETRIVASGKKIEKVSLSNTHVAGTPSAVSAIREADIIIMGPGSLYTSVIPNLIIPDIAEALRQSCAIKLYVCNIMTQRGETDGYTASDHINTLIKHTSKDILDYAILNGQTVPADMLGRYEAEGSRPVGVDTDIFARFERSGIRVGVYDLVSLDDGVVRHNTQRLAEIIAALYTRLMK